MLFLPTTDRAVGFAAIRSDMDRMTVQADTLHAALMVRCAGCRVDPCQCDTRVDLHAALATIPAEVWSPPSNYADNHVHHRYSRCPLVDAGTWRPEAEAFRPWLGAYDVHDAWLSRIQPGGYIVPHTDRSRWRERWHIPIQAAGWMILGCGYPYGDTEAVFDEVGMPLRVEHWLPHAVENQDDHDRIHLIIDTTEYVGPNEIRPFVVL